MNTEAEDVLRAEFTTRANQLACGAAPYPELRRRIARRRSARIAGVAVAAALVGVAGIGSGLTLAARHPGPAATVTPGRLVVGGCGSTLLYRGAPPAWTAVAQAPAGLAYVESSHGNAVGFLFADVLRAGTPSGGQNKILWVVRATGAEGGPLTIATRPLDSPGSAQLRHEETGLGSGVYPSITDVPAPGCWHFGLTWTGGSATVDLPYSPPR